MAKIPRLYIGAAIAIIIIVVGAVAYWVYIQQVEHQLIVIHPHSSAFANHVINDFNSWVQETQGYTILVSQLTPGDSSAVLDQVLAWNAIPAADIYWGGGSYNFEDAANLHSWAPTSSNASFLLPYKTLYDA